MVNTTVDPSHVTKYAGGKVTPFILLHRFTYWLRVTTGMPVHPKDNSSAVLRPYEYRWICHDIRPPHGTEATVVIYRKRKLSCNSCFRSCPRDQFLFTMLQLSSTLYQERWVSFLLLEIVCHSGHYLRCMTIEKLATYLSPNLFRNCMYCPLAYGI